MSNKTNGILGEEKAQKHYESEGYEILEKNYRYKRAEIDLIVLKDEKVLVFVEVKMRSSNSFGEAETFVSESQQERIREAAEDYIYGINWMKDIRFDIVSVDKEGNIMLFEDAF
ncbi:MAG: YraN family protein [Ekhidna sp.]|nr:YraN family protein [Ekhidna sp.]